MCVGENRFRRAEKPEQGEDAADISAFRTSRVKLSVAERAGASFSEAVIAVAVNRSFRTDFSYRFFARVRFFAPFDDDRRDAVFEQAECAEQARGTGSYDDDALPFVGRLPCGDLLCRLLIRGFSDVRVAAQTYPYATVPRIDRTLCDCEPYVFGTGADIFFRKRFRRFIF